MDTATIPKRAAAIGCAAALAASCCIAALPQQAYASGGKTLSSFERVNLYDDAHSAAKLIWGSDSKVVPLGGSHPCSSNWYSEQAWYCGAAGDGVLLTNVGTDLDGDSYDFRVEASNVKAGALSIDVRNERFEVPEAGDRMDLDFSANFNGEGTFKVSYLKHGTSTPANVKALAAVYDLDGGDCGDSYPSYMFKGHEGVSFNGASGLYYTNGTPNVGIDLNAAKFWNKTLVSQLNPDDNLLGKDLDGAVLALLDESSYSFTFSGAHGCGVSMFFDTQEVPGNPCKEARLIANAG